MPNKTSKKKPAGALPTIPKELIDQFVSSQMSAEAVNAASMAFKKALIERALGAELSHHLGYRPGAEKPGEVGNHAADLHRTPDRNSLDYANWKDRKALAAAIKPN